MRRAWPWTCSYDGGRIDRGNTDSVLWYEIDRAETARIIENNDEILVGFEKEMVVGAQLLWSDSPLAGHAEMENHRVAAVGIDQPIFPAPVEFRHPGAGQPLPEPSRKGAS